MTLGANWLDRAGIYLRRSLRAIAVLVDLHWDVAQQEAQGEQRRLVNGLVLLGLGVGLLTAAAALGDRRVGIAGLRDAVARSLRHSRPRGRGPGQRDRGDRRPPIARPLHGANPGPPHSNRDHAAPRHPPRRGISQCFVPRPFPTLAIA